MEFSTVMSLLAALVIGIVLLLVILAVVVRRRSAEIEDSADPPESFGAVSDAKYEAGELPASLVSEQIEEMVRKQLAAYPDLAELKLDFATGPDESLVIWVNDQKYADVSQIPDHRIRSAVSEAVDTFNR